MKALIVMMALSAPAVQPFELDAESFSRMISYRYPEPTPLLIRFIEEENGMEFMRSMLNDDEE